ncbi:MAG: class I SAM-dependent methyltransferase family protein [Actinomycetota bacterium]
MSTFYNRTRVSRSIPRRLIRDGKWPLLPVYALLRTSDLAREGIDNSGSWRFADHIYEGRPSGRFVAGTALDALLLSLPSTRSFRGRYLFVRREVERRLPILLAGRDRPVTVLSLPSGIPRDIAEAAASLRRRGAVSHEAARFVGIDLDPEALAAGHALVERLGVADAFDLVEGDAFDSSRFPQPLDVLTSTGFGEFLDDEQLRRFLEQCHDALAPGGVLLTTASERHRFSDYLLRELGEIRVRYRSRGEIEDLLRAAGFGTVRTATDRRRLQTFAVAEKAQT